MHRLWKEVVRVDDAGWAEAVLDRTTLREKEGVKVNGDGVIYMIPPPDGGIYLQVPEDMHEVYGIITRWKELLVPWGLRVVEIGEDVTAVGDSLDYGNRYAVIQVKKRVNPVVMGEFYIQDLHDMMYAAEVKSERVSFD